MDGALGTLKLLWLEPKVQFKGKGIITAWGEEMARKGWIIETDPNKWEDCDLVFFGSDSQINLDIMEKKPTITYFWGWMPERFLEPEWARTSHAKAGIMAQSTRVLCPSIGVQDQLFTLGIPNQLCLPGIDTGSLDLGGETFQRQPQVVFISRLVPHKGLDILIYAASLLNPSPKVIAIGPGDRFPYQELANQLKVNIEFLEPDDSEKAKILRSSAVLVHPSYYEGFGLPPLEALYCGTPVIVNDTPQMRWLLQEDGLYFSSIQGLANTIVEVFNNLPNYVYKASIASVKIKKTYSLEAACDRLWAHIHQVIKAFLAQELRDHPEKWQEIYDKEHRRNYAYAANRFDPTWERHWRAQSVIKVLKDYKCNSVMDIGCGPVYPTILARAGFNVTAIDISGECIRQVDEVANKWGQKDKIEAYIGDAKGLDFDDSTFDAIIQGEIWEHVPDVEQVIREGLRLVKQGGILMASTPMGKHHYDPMHFRVFDDKMLNDLLDKFRPDCESISVDKIAEEGTDPSCYFIVMRKKNG